MTTQQPAEETFLGREHSWFGIKIRNYLLIMMVIFALLPFVRRGAQWAIQANNNNVADWLPPNYAESAELAWFQKHFVGEQFALVSWEGCTLGDTQKLDLLAEKLAPKIAPASKNSTTRLFKKVTSGPSVLAELTSNNKLEISHEEAIRRLEGALIGPLPPGATSDKERTTCLVVTLSDEGSSTNRKKREALDAIRTAAMDCKIPMEGEGRIRFGGPPVDNVAIDIEGERTLIRLSLLAGAVGIILSYLCFRSFRLTAMVFAVGGLAAGISLAIVSYFGLMEQLLFNLAKPKYGTVDAILMSMPAVVYVLGLSGAIHMVNYYRDARREEGIIGAAEAAVRHSFAPCTLAALTTAVGLGSLFTSDILPIQKFGMFSAIGVVATLSLLFSLLPACLHRFPPAEEAEKTEEQKLADAQRHPLFLALLHWFERIIIDHNGKVAIGSLLVMAAFGYGLAKIETRVQLLKLFDEDAVIIHDYAWLEQHLGNLVPMEVILAIDSSHQRAKNQHAEADGKHYKLTMFERLKLVQRVQETIDDLPETGRSLSAATFGPDLSVTGGTRDTTNLVMMKNRDQLLASDYLRDEIRRPYRPGEDFVHDRTNAKNSDGTGRILMRISARLPALQDIDYGHFVTEIRAAVDPVLHVYRQRDDIVAALHKKGKTLRLADVVIVYNSQKLNGSAPDVQSLELLNELLVEASARSKLYDLGAIPAEADRQEVFTQIEAALSKVECVVTAGNTGELDLKALAAAGPAVVPLNKIVLSAEPDRTSVEGIRAAYTGVIPLVYKTQRELLVSLQESMMWATVLIAVVMIVVFRSVPAGFLCMVPNVFPIVLVFGAIGWLGIKVDIGIMMCASVALGVAVDDTVHFLTWFREGVREGLDNKEATRAAFERCAAAMFQTTLIAGFGLAVFAASTFTPTQQFGVLMLTLLSAALVGDLVVLPALLSGPLGRFFRSGVKPYPAVESAAASRGTSDAAPPTGGPHLSPQNKARRDLPHSSMRT